jgi:hypothetical protein
MARVTSALLEGKAFSKGRTQPMLDLTYGGQLGYAPNLPEWVSNQAYIRRNLFCLLIEAPKFFQSMPDPDKWVQTLRALVELHPRTIEGLNGGLTVETAETPVGGGGEMQEEFTDVKKARSQPVFTFDEKYGMPIQTFLRDWITNGLMDPDSKVASIGTLAKGTYPTDMLADQYAATMIFIEPDPTHRKVVKSWLTTNMFPKGTGDIVGKRDLTAGGELTSLNIEFTGISQFNLGSNILAQTLLDNINITNANPYLRPAFVNGIDPKVDTNGIGSTGYNSGITNMAGVALNKV